MGLDWAPLHPSGGALVTPPRPLAPLSGLDTAAVAALFLAEGALLFRGFDVDGRSFEWFAERFSDAFCVDAGATRAAVPHLEPPTRQVISARPERPFGLHAEMASSTPQRPRLLWLLCVAAPLEGGETWVCDGQRVYDALSPRAREIFGPGVQVRHGSKPPVPVLSQAPGAQRPAFANALVGRTGYATIARQATFADGRPLDAAAWQEARDASVALTVPVRWQEGDLLMLDNLRFMHGRPAFAADELRVLYSRVAWALRASLAYTEGG